MGFLPMKWRIIHLIRPFLRMQVAGTGGTMVEDLQIRRELMRDMLGRLSGKGKKGREAAIEALAVSTEGSRSSGTCSGKRTRTSSFLPLRLSSPLRRQARKKRLSVTG